MPSVRLPRSPSLAVIALVAVSAGGLAGYGDGDDRAAPTGPSMPVSSTRVPSARPAAVAANLLEICDHVQEAFRDGGLGDADQDAGLATELTGMTEVAQPAAAKALRPLIAAAQAIAADGRDAARPRLRRAENQAVERLQRACVAAGSTAWSE